MVATGTLFWLSRLQAGKSYGLTTKYQTPVAGWGILGWSAGALAPGELTGFNRAVERKAEQDRLSYPGEN